MPAPASMLLFFLRHAQRLGERPLRVARVQPLIADSYLSFLDHSWLLCGCGLRVTSYAGT
jgi:hypothetical protein